MRREKKKKKKDGGGGVGGVGCDDVKRGKTTLVKGEGKMEEPFGWS